MRPSFFNTIFSPPLLILGPFKQLISTDLRQSKRRRGTPARVVGARAIALRPLRLLQRPLRLRQSDLSGNIAGGLAKVAGGFVQSLKSQRSETMRQARVWVVALAAAALAALAFACAGNTTQTGSAGYQRKTKKAGEPVYIGFSMDTLKEERWQRDKALVEARAKEVGAQLDVLVANSDDAVQTNQCATLLTKGVDVLIVAPHNGEIAASIVENAHSKGVPVISYDRLIRNSEPDLYVSHQVEKMGEMQGKYALDHVPKGNYVLIGGAPTDNNAMLLRKGQMNVLQPAKDRGDIQIISDQFAKDWRADEALRLTEDAITRTNGNIQAAVAPHHRTAGGGGPPPPTPPAR